MKTTPSDRGTDDGFTLTELLVVVLIIGILAAIALPVFFGQQTKAYRDAVMSDVRNASLVLENYYAEHIRYPATGLVPGFTPTDGVHVEIMASTLVGYCLQGHHIGLDENADGVPDPFYFETRTLKAMSNVAPGACT